MNWSIRLGRIAGTELKIHLTFILFLAWIAIVHWARGGAPAAIEGVIYISLIFGCVLLHELGHATAARAYGIPTPDITLLPIGGVARLQRMPDKPAQELVVALAGPLVNVIIALGLFFVLGQLSSPLQFGWVEDPRVHMLSRLASVNVMLVLFNLIPAFPMDGGRVLRALLAMALPYSRATQVAAGIGQGLAFVFGFVGLFYNPLLIFIAFFIYLGAAQENVQAQMRELSRELPVTAAMVTHFATLPERATVADAVEALLRTSQHDFPVVNPGTGVLGVLTRDQVINAVTRNEAHSPISAIMHRAVPTVSTNDSFEHAFRTMQESHCPAVPVLSRRGELVGLITPENVGEMMMMRSVLPRGASPSWREDGVLQEPRVSI
jgi:Zn-dependent protease/CBS domain-containing protein